MQISISKEEQIVLQELKQDLIKIKRDLIEWSIGLLILFKDSVIQFILSYDEFALSNIKSKGFLNILTDRALRFFKLDQNEVEERRKASDKPKKRTIKYYILKSVKVILFPVYLIMCAVLVIFSRKQKKNVINKYET
jgi:hypothetical protein